MPINKKRKNKYLPYLLAAMAIMVAIQSISGERYLMIDKQDIMHAVRYVKMELFPIEYKAEYSVR